MTATITTITITARNNLSDVPKVWIAHSLTGPGVRLMTAVPTDVRASAAGEKNAATNSVTPKETAAAAKPAPMREAVEVTGPVLSGAVLLGAVLSGPVLLGAVLSGPVLSGPVLSGAGL